MPSGAAVKVQRPFVGLHASMVHAMKSLHTVSVPRQTPAVQVSPDEHALPSEQVAPSPAAVDPQTPPAHVVVTQGTVLAGQVGLAVHLPSAHTSPEVQGSPSLQPAALFTLAHAPLTQAVSVQALPSGTQQAPPQQTCPGQRGDRMHTPPTQFATSHASVAVQGTAGQVPYWQPAVTLHVPPDEAVQRLSMGTCVQTPAAQPSTVHAIPSSQSRAIPGTPLPPRQVSPTVQPSPSSKGSVSSAVFAQPTRGSQSSRVQTLVSSQLRAVPPPHSPRAPASQVSPMVQALASLQVPTRLGC